MNEMAAAHATRFVEPRPRSLVNPQLIVEALSESTERHDRGDKWLAYRTIPSLTDHVMISSIRREVEHDQRLPDGSWTLRPPQRDGESVLASGVILDVNRLYRLVPWAWLIEHSGVMACPVLGHARAGDLSSGRILVG